MEKIKNKEKYLKIVFVAIMFILCFIWSCSQPFGGAPDETMKMDICRYIMENNRLPHGGDEAVRHPIWGISYGFTPILSYIISAIFMKIVALFTSNEFSFIIAARFVSILCYTGTVIMVLKIAEKLFSGIYKWVFTVLISCLPQFVFLGTYINNDSLALFSISIIVYSWILGIQNKWNLKSCMILAIGIGLCALSYYNAYGFILASVILYITSHFIEYGKKINIKEFIKKGLIITSISCLIAGWWFVRSAIIYNGDFLGLKTTDEYAEQYASEEYKPSQRQTPEKQNVSLLDMLVHMKWVNTTYKSFVGVFGNMEILMHMKYYYISIMVFSIGGIGFLIKIIKTIRSEKNKKVYHKINLAANMGLCIVIPILLSLYYSYYSDFQPQGRYIMPILIPFMYVVTVGIRELSESILGTSKRKNIIKNIGLTVLCIGWFLIPVVSFTNVVIPFYLR